MRKNFFISGLIGIIMYITVRNNVEQEKKEFEYITGKNILIKENDRLKELDNERLRGENKEMKEKNKIVDSLKIELEIIKRTEK